MIRLNFKLISWLWSKYKTIQSWRVIPHWTKWVMIVRSTLFQVIKCISIANSIIVLWDFTEAVFKVIEFLYSMDRIAHNQNDAITQAFIKLKDNSKKKVKEREFRITTRRHLLKRAWRSSICIRLNQSPQQSGRLMLLSKIAGWYQMNHHKKILYRVAWNQST